MALTINAPRMFGEFYVSDAPMSAVPTSLTAFKWDLSNAIHQTTDIERSNDIQTEDYSIYGAEKDVTHIVGNKVSYAVTQLVAVDVDPESWFMRLHNIDLSPMDNTLNKVAYLARGLDPSTGLPIDGDYFCPEASISITSGSLHFGAASDMREVEITFNESLPGMRVDTIAGLVPEAPILPPAGVSGEAKPGETGSTPKAPVTK